MARRQLAAVVLAQAALWAPGLLARPRPAHRAGPEPRPHTAFALANWHAALRFSAPADRGDGFGPELTVQLQATGLNAASGSHLHLLLDDLPPLETPVVGPVTLRRLSPGPHSLRAVLCGPGHEVLKAPHAFALTRFWVGPRPEDAREAARTEREQWPDPRKPILTVIRPTGEPATAIKLEPAHDATPEDGAPRLDFYLANCRLGRRACSIKVTLDDRELPLLRSWESIPLHAQSGERHELRVELLDRRAQVARNAVNRVDRSFTAP